MVIERGVQLGDMQRHLSSAFSKRFPTTQIELVIGEQLWTNFTERPLLHEADGAGVEVRFTRATGLQI